MGSGWGGQGGCEQRIEVFVRIQKKYFFWGGGGGQVEGGGGQGRCEQRSEVTCEHSKFSKDNN